MSKDLVIYNGQSNRIDQLVGKYGGSLEVLSRETKLLLRITLSTYVLVQREYTSTEYPVSEAVEDALCQLVIPHNVPQDLYDVCSLLEGLTVDEAESILDALQYQLHWGNARTIINE
ncbi:MAG: hypothetical protein KME32_35045 [Mojavia pulchra JT2-VF2]|jgi:hypothetical protein|uniref:Uncharacterized protein n=1 Tax=Mojavia pulchra JT2-VF2 TaxID=287848 RepID=A0A951Q532_9NOST|nr:hypothetical protein [Mojavia pulchra JT2-VF2]